MDDLIKFSEFQEMREQLSVPVPGAHPFKMSEKEGSKFFHARDAKTKIQQKAFKIIRDHPSLSSIAQLALKHHLKTHPDRRPYKGKVDEIH